MTTTAINTKDLLLSLNDKPIVIFPAYIRITGDYATAAALAQVLYWHKTMGGRKFYKTDADFSSELILTPKQFERIKGNLKSLDFLIITREQIPAKTFYDVDYDKLAIALCGQTTPEPPLPPAESSYPQKGETVPPQKGEHLPPQKGESNTENTQRLPETTTTKASPPVVPIPENVVVVLKAVFKTDSEQQTALKTLAGLRNQNQAFDVLKELEYAKKKKSIPSPQGYLYSLCEKANSGAFTATYNATQAPKTEKPQETAAERAKREEMRLKVEDERHKQAAKRADADLAEKLAMLKLKGVIA